MWEGKYKIEGQIVGTSRTIQFFMMPLLEVVQSKRGKNVFFDVCCYTIKKKLQFQYIWNVSSNVA